MTLNSQTWNNYKARRATRELIDPDATLIRAHSNAVANTTTVIYTVASGKTAYIYMLSIQAAMGSAAAAIAEVRLRDSGQNLVQNLYYQVFAAVGIDSIALPFQPCLQVPASHDIAIVSDHADLDVSAQLHGYLETP